MRLVVVGGTGFLGPSVVHQLVDAGHEVTIIHRGGQETPLPSNVRHVHAPRSALVELRADLKRLRPQAAIDMRAMTEEDASSTVSAFVGIAERLVVVSSSDVYRAYGRLRRLEPGAPDIVPLREDAPLRTALYPDRGAPKHDRAEDLALYDKVLVERAARLRPELPATILRLGFVHGPRSYRHYPYVRRMLDQRPGIVIEEQFAGWRGTYAYSENVAAAIVLAATNAAAAGAVYNVGEPNSLSVLELVEAMADAVGWTGRIAVVPADRLPEDMRPWLFLDQHFVLDTRRIRSDLDYREGVPLVDGLLRTIDWVRSNPPGPDDPMGHLTLDYATEDGILAKPQAQS